MGETARTRSFAFGKPRRDYCVMLSKGPAMNRGTEDTTRCSSTVGSRGEHHGTKDLCGSHRAE